ncbi:MAG: DMT family transporter [Lachnospiraceae bacterium]|nr:DMT family transporter [Lachnospiraceae bacterium]
MNLICNRETSGNLMLLFAAVIWGTAFAAQSAAMDRIGPHTMNAVRCLTASVSLFPVSLLFRRHEKKHPPVRQLSPFGIWTLALGGLVCGLALFGATTLQQMGLVYTLVGKAGFITALYIVLVPILGLFLGKPVRALQWCCVGIAVVALYLLSVSGVSEINKGDLMMLGCALVFAVHIHLIDYFAPRVNGVMLSCLQFLVAGLISLIPMFLLEEPSWLSLRAAAFPILYAGMLSGGIAYTLQILGQERTNPVTGSLIMSTESLWALIAGIFILHESLSGKELLGGALMIIALILSQVSIPFRKHPIVSHTDHDQ